MTEESIVYGGSWISRKSSYTRENPPNSYRDSVRVDETSSRLQDQNRRVPSSDIVTRLAEYAVSTHIVISFGNHTVQPGQVGNN